MSNPASKNYTTSRRFFFSQRGHKEELFFSLSLFPLAIMAAEIKRKLVLHLVTDAAWSEYSVQPDSCPWLAGSNDTADSSKLLSSLLT